MPENITKPIVLDQTANRLADALERVSIKSDIVDNLTTESATKALSANQGKVLDDKIGVNADAITSLSSDLSALSGIVPKIVYRSEDSASYTFSEGHDNMFLVLCKSRNSDSYAVYLVLDRNALLRVNTIGNNSLTYSVSSKTMTVSGASDINMSVVKMW